jgi:hypothetical protein
MAKTGMMNAAQDLGLGDQLQAQVDQELAARKKKNLLTANQGSVLGAATQALFPQGMPGV